jgi:hypothetical protein
MTDKSGTYARTVLKTLSILWNQTKIDGSIDMENESQHLDLYYVTCKQCTGTVILVFDGTHSQFVGLCDKCRLVSALSEIGNRYAQSTQ